MKDEIQKTGNAAEWLAEALKNWLVMQPTDVKNEVYLVAATQGFKCPESLEDVGKQRERDQPKTKALLAKLLDTVQFGSVIPKKSNGKITHFEIIQTMKAID